MDVAEACRLHHRHLKWLAHWDKDGATSEKAPRPGFKDCENCPLRKQACDSTDRRSICEVCPWAEYPDSPGEAFFFAQEVAMYPDYFLAQFVDEMTWAEHKNVAMVRKQEQAWLR